MMRGLGLLPRVSWCSSFSLRPFSVSSLKGHEASISRTDVIVVGGGHAGTEAALASARMGCSTVLLTHKFSTIGEMSCNPSFGGIGKGHLLREIDALGGASPSVCDLSGTQYKVLNKRKGPAVWGLRAQIDRDLYKKHMQELVRNTPNLRVVETAVDDLVVTEGVCKGVVLADSSLLHASAVIITTGTFLRGEINIGLDVRPAGRIGDEPAVALAQTFDRLGFQLKRLKTGTPPRLLKSSINFDILEEQLGDDPPVPFSFMNSAVWLRSEDQLPCHITKTNEGTEAVVRRTLDRNRHVTEEVGRGPRYCPSIESKILRFPRRPHQIWLEPEGFQSPLVYPNGLSVTMPADEQIHLLRGIRGLENVVMTRPGYGVTYDHVDPRQLTSDLQTKKVAGLFLAGQINGTTGYEEAAAQGILAGANAAAQVLGLPQLSIDRSEGYLGVLVDDLIRVGAPEPYRMFTSRAEFRLSLRPDNADLRLTHKGVQLGLVSKDRAERTMNIQQRLQRSLEELSSIQYSSVDWQRRLDAVGVPVKLSPSGRKTALDILAMEAVEVAGLHKCLERAGVGNELQLVSDLWPRIKVEATYFRSVEQEKTEVAQMRAERGLKFPKGFDFSTPRPGLVFTKEEQEKLTEACPEDIGALSAIPGVTPATVLRLIHFLRRSGPSQALPPPTPSQPLKPTGSLSQLSS